MQRKDNSSPKSPRSATRVRRHSSVGESFEFDAQFFASPEVVEIKAMSARRPVAPSSRATTSFKTLSKLPDTSSLQRDRFILIDDAMSDENARLKFAGVLAEQKKWDEAKGCITWQMHHDDRFQYQMRIYRSGQKSQRLDEQEFIVVPYEITSESGSATFQVATQTVIQIVEKTNGLRNNSIMLVGIVPDTKDQESINTATHQLQDFIKKNPGLKGVSHHVCSLGGYEVFSLKEKITREIRMGVALQHVRQTMVTALDAYKKEVQQRCCAKQSEKRRESLHLLAKLNADLQKNTQSNESQLFQLVAALKGHLSATQSHHKMGFFGCLTSSSLVRAYEKILKVVPSEIYNQTQAKEVVFSEKRAKNSEPAPAGYARL